MQLVLIDKMLTFNGVDIPFILDENNRPWFKGNTVASLLGYAVPSQAVYRNVK